VVVLIAKSEMQKAPLVPRQGIGGVLLCGGSLDFAGPAPAAVFADSHTLSAHRKLDEDGALPACDQALAGAAAETVQLAPIVE
jgi:hypothetical protein